jgi:hypothetical protein
LGLQSAILPYSMMHFLTSSMSHVDESKDVLELGNVVHHRKCVLIFFFSSILFDFYLQFFPLNCICFRCCSILSIWSLATLATPFAKCFTSKA